MFNNNKICVGIVAHVDAGKTTITEQFLYKAGVKQSVGRVDHKDTTADFLSVEKERGITVRATTVAFPWNDKQIHLLDTPGHMDFIAEVERSLSVLDAAVLAISAKEGVQVQTRVIYNALKRLGIPTIIFINKVDRMGVNLEPVYEDIKQYLSESIVVMQSVEGEGTRDIVMHSYESQGALIAEIDDVLSLHCDTYLEHVLENTVSPVERSNKIGELFRKTDCVPVLHGSALHGIGIDALLDSLSLWVNFQEKEDLLGRCYKVDRDVKGQRRCFIRMYGGKLILRNDYPVRGSIEQIKIRQMAVLNGIEAEKVEEAGAGDVVILYDNDLKIEDCIGVAESKSYEKETHISIPTLISNVKYCHLGQRKEILKALDVLTDEDPFLDYRIHPVTEAIEVKLFGVVQKEILLDLFKERFDIATEIADPVTLYKEKPSEKSQAFLQMYRHTLLPASVGLEITPLPVGSGFQYESKVSLGDLKRPFQTAVFEGVKKAIQDGVGEWALTDLKVVFYDSEYDSVNSTPADFRKLAPEVLKSALSDQKLTLLEPLLEYELHVPQYAVGKAVADVLKMKGDVGNPELVDDNAILRGIIPVDTCKCYVQELADYTSGKGVFNTKFFGYREIARDEI